MEFLTCTVDPIGVLHFCVMEAIKTGRRGGPGNMASTYIAIASLHHRSPVIYDLICNSPSSKVCKQLAVQGILNYRGSDALMWVFSSRTKLNSKPNNNHNIHVNNIALNCILTKSRG